MIFCVEKETDVMLPFDAGALGEEVAEALLASEHCPFESGICLLLTDDAGIRELNRTHRGADTETDVLSFPALAFPSPAAFEAIDPSLPGVTDPENGAVWLGDIALSVPRAFAQAEAYGHSIRREFAFLVAHSVLHLIGYDHTAEEAAKDMELRQEQVLESLHITRDCADGAARDGEHDA